jgi:acyl-coenzyme A synthetase/AMP-(fatty) acid ligase
VCAMALLSLHTPQVNLPSHETGVNKRALALKLSVGQIIAEQPEKWMEGTGLIIAPVLGLVAAPLATTVLAANWREGRPHDAVGIYQNTSGSTNVPKTFGLTLERLIIISERLAKEPYERRVLRTGSIEFDSSRLQHICTLLAGNTCVLSGQVRLRDLARLCERAEVTEIQMGTYKLAALLNSEVGEARRLPALTRIVSGGSRVPGPLRRKIKAFLTDNLWGSYSTSELGPVSLASPEDHDAFPEGVGTPLHGVRVEILDDDGNLAAPGQIGEARVRKRGTPSEYLRDPVASSAFRDGWFYPRDLLSRCEPGPLIFHGRADDMMILNGINIFPAAIEDTLESHPDVREAAAFAVKSRIHGEIPVAAVVLSEGARHRNTSYLMEHCRRSLGVRAPRKIFVVDRIPRNHAGKPLRRELASS